MLRKVIFISLLFATTVLSAVGSSRPKLVVNIIVGGMRAGDIERYSSSFGGGGFLRLRHGGVYFTNAHYTSSQSITSSSLATLSTGATPSIHGVVGDVWWERISGSRVELTHDAESKGVAYNLKDYNHSAEQLIAPTITESLLSASPSSKSISISIEPSAAILMSGSSGVPYWIEPLSCEWGSSTSFIDSLPAWVATYNKSPQIAIFANERWVSRLQQNGYKNSFSDKLKPRISTRRYEADAEPRAKGIKEQRQRRFEQLQSTPVGNRALFDFARTAIEREELGRDGSTDIVNIYLCTSRNIAQSYGSESIEVEDMYCHLDRDIDEFITAITKDILPGDIIITLSSDHGMTPNTEPRGLFDIGQFTVVVNSFLRARYGGEGWVLGYNSRNLYLNHKEIYRQKLTIQEVQNEVAAFALQFRGVSHALTATALNSGAFASGYGAKIQRGFYARRSGDVIISLMPGWIEQQQGRRADSGSIYHYDSHVPLIIYGEGYFTGRTTHTKVEMESLAPTLAYILGIDAPVAAEGEAINEILEL